MWLSGMWGDRMDRFWQQVEASRKEHTSLPFWSWNDRLDSDELVRQIEAMRAAGIGGFFMHARGGLETPYMGEEWMQAIRTGIDGAGDDMEAWAYDENGWPSGFADGIVPAMGEQNQQKTLRPCVVGKDDFAPADVLGYYHRIGDDLVMTDVPEEGDLAVVCVINRYYIDTMNPDTIRDFLNVTHEKYYKTFGDEFGKGLKGFFTDEPQYHSFGTPWSPALENAWHERYGDELRPHLGWLFTKGDKGRPVRARFYALAGELYRRHFLKQMYDWCETHGCELTGHVMQEDNLLVQIGSTGGAMAAYEYFHMPGIDWLGRDIGSPVTPKQLGSVAAQLGKKRALTETFALCGWDVSFNELRGIAQWQMVNGVNRLCQHLSAYSLRGIRKRDYPPSLHVQQPWFDEYSGFNDYMSRLGSALAQGTEMADVLLIQPMQSVAAVFNPYDPAAAAEIHRDFENTSIRLDKLHIGHHYGDETIMAKYGCVRGQKLVIGEMSYSTVLLPPCTTLPKAVVDLLYAFALAGGKIYSACETAPLDTDCRCDCAERDIPSFVRCLADCDDTWKRCLSTENTLTITKDGQDCDTISCMVRRLDDGRRLFFVTNRAADVGECTLSIAGDVRLTELDMIQTRENVTTVRQENGRTTWTASFAAFESHLWIETASTQAVSPRPTEAIQLTDDMTLVRRTDNLLTLDICQYRIDGGEWQPEKAVILLHRDLLAMKKPCDIEMKFTFTAANASDIGALYLAMETPWKYTLMLNGQPLNFVDAGCFGDSAFRKCDIRTCLQEGENELLVCGRFHQRQKVYDVLFGENVHETEKNKLTLDTELESLYLVGDFGVHLNGDYHRGERRAIHTSGAFVLTPPPADTRIGDITIGDYWFFAGKMRFAQTVSVRKQEGKDYYVSLKNLYAPAATVWVNGQKAGTLAFTPYCVTVTDWLIDGDNRIEIELLSGNRNWLGPHHRPCGESYSVGPATFTDEQGWSDQNDPGPYWTNDYSFVEFGAKL